MSGVPAPHLLELLESLLLDNRDLDSTLNELAASRPPSCPTRASSAGSRSASRAT
ncbi:hypothetical protein SAMN04488544_1325 [Microlunatus sagamiharensis]|uniref:Uncharacterized protein n=1 Tax=Microlunatus sagamiharensis TaxID=546874 RepID=A0A1H2M474_9ACTN|nr:hypothetical protein [Microlunatus sagamiharensis]SDU87691.1 hypothetical protein SAMN04488544_1325 [Microlunatus sagamiharensis]